MDNNCETDGVISSSGQSRKNFAVPPTVNKNRPLPVPVERSIIESSSSSIYPIHPKYATYESRIKTFNNWSIFHCQDPKKLALSGFFYSGFEDETICFYCGMGIKEWERDDCPFQEHARWMNTCGYLELYLDDGAIRGIKKKKPPVVGRDIRKFYI